MMLLAAVSGRGALYPEAFSNGRPVGPIPDGNPAGVAFGGSGRDIPAGGTVSGVSISGGFTGDLYAYLLVTNGTPVEPLNQPVASGAGGAITFDGSLTDGNGTLNFADLWTGGAVPAFPGLPVNQTEKVAGLTAAATGFTSGVSSAFNVGKWAATVAATGGNKTYDGTTTAMVTLADHQVFGGAVGYTRASFGWQNAGHGQPDSVSGNTISGPAAGNYNFQNLFHNITASTSASLPALAVTWSGSRAYDRPTAAANLTPGNNFNGVNLTLPGSVPLAVKNAGAPMISAVALGGSAPVSRTVVSGAAVWNFDTGTNNTSAYAAGSSYKANNITTTVFNKAGSMTSINKPPSGSKSAGTGDPGVALQFTAQSGTGKSVNTANFVLSLVVATAVQSITSITITYNYWATTGTGAAIDTWVLTGGGGGTKTASITQNSAWNTATVTFSGLTLVGGNAFTLTDTMSGYANGNSSSIVAFDNISLNANVVPEPVNVALGIFGGLLGGLGLVRHHATKRRSVLQPQA